MQLSQIVCLLIDVYFGLALGIAGLIKINNYASFIHILQHHYRFPKWISNTLGKVFPWIEIFLAISLLVPLPLYRLIVTWSIIFIFLLFLLCKIVLIRRSHLQSNCGCYGEITRKQNVLESTLTLIIQIAALSFLLFLIYTAPSPLWQCYLMGFGLLIGSYIWFLFQIWKRRQALLAQSN
ncbi:hypothetical protein EPA93_24275 [Ktedonosporobacter rubrisoli]|uniref:Methylamine utilisation protein MauE domain-containing protein n=1 Tax=Ktedonosporobacter rubrisoli TaxID=2509675 RepID=A0A4P6JUE1_KTERU|nr:hypothetical protein EPA93_24275 [Ktedonosporobacter rubrisoli]